MTSQLASLLNTLRYLAERLWAYLGTLAAASLMLAALGMGIYHALIRNSLGSRYACYESCFCPAGALPPQGIGPLAEAGEHCAVPHVRLEKEPESERSRSICYINAQGHKAPFPGSAVAEQRLHYDAAGRLESKQNLDAAGQPAEDSTGVATRRFRYNALGLLVEMRLEDAAGAPVMPRVPGYAQLQWDYDAQGRLCGEKFLDGRGQPSVNAFGESEIRYDYDEAARRVTRCNLRQGRPANNRLGFATETRELSEDGSRSSLSWADENGQPVRQPALGAAALISETDAQSRTQRSSLHDESGGLIPSRPYPAQALRRYNPQGLVEWEGFYNADTQRCLKPERGYAERVCEYSPKGELLREYFWDASDNPSRCYERHHTRDASGRHVISLYADGSSSYSPALAELPLPTAALLTSPLREAAPAEGQQAAAPSKGERPLPALAPLPEANGQPLWLCCFPLPPCQA